MEKHLSLNNKLNSIKKYTNLVGLLSVFNALFFTEFIIHVTENKKYENKKQII
tara:strand:- start:521 stop:679 length:159 start_codon:yes stop_codon:yes gene_type:complete